MIILNSKLMMKSGGLYNLHDDQNLTELKSMMKDLIIKEQPSQTTKWAETKATSTASTQTDANGGRVWAYAPKKKKRIDGQDIQAVMPDLTIRSLKPL